MQTENQSPTPEQREEIINQAYEVSKKFLIVLALLFTKSLIKAIGLKALWFWFIIPTFNLPALSLASCIGIIIIVNYIISKTYNRSEEDVENILEEISVDYFIKEIKATSLKSLVILGFSYAIHLFI